MAVKQSANGADALMGIMLDEPTADLTDGREFSVGRPSPRELTVSAPTAPTATIGGDPGPVDGVFRWALVQHILAADGARGPLGTWTGSTTCDARTGVALESIPAAATIQFTDIYREHQLEDGSWSAPYIVGRLYDNTATTFTDALPSDSVSIRYDQPPPTASEVGANHQLLFEGADSIDWNPQHGRIQSSELSSGEGEVASTPGPVKVQLTIKQATRAAYDVPTAQSLLGLCTVKGVEGDAELATPVAFFDEPTRIFDFDSANARLNPRTFSGLFYPGGDVRPEWGEDFCGQEMEVAVDEGKLVTSTFKAMGVGYTTLGVGTHVSGAGTYHTTGRRPMLYGLFDETVRALDDVYEKITRAPSGGYFESKIKIGSGSSYSGAAIRTYYNTGSDKKLRRGGSNALDRIELLDESGYAIGFDTGENRLPLSRYFPGDVTGLAVDDIFKYPKEELIPGIGDGGARFSGQIPVRFPSPRYTQAHAYMMKSGAPVKAISAKMKLTAPADDFAQLGKDAMFAEDIERSGKLKCELELKRRFNTKEWQNALRQNQAFPVVFQLEGERIWVSPGVRSTYRRLWRLTLNECEVMDTSEAIGNDKVVLQTVKLRARQPIDGTTSFCNLRLVTDKLWTLPS